MSPDDWTLTLSPSAVSDFAGILQYTLENWGETQMKQYRAIIDKSLQTILDNPLIGMTRPEISEHYRSFPAGRHVVFYRVLEREIWVARLLHGNMDFGKSLS